jgi:hypothetical protein
MLSSVAIAWITDAEAGLVARKEQRKPLFADFWTPI